MIRQILTVIIFLFITGCTALAPGELESLLVGGAMGANQWAREEKFLRELHAPEQQQMLAPFKIRCNDIGGGFINCRAH